MTIASDTPRAATRLREEAGFEGTESALRSDLERFEAALRSDLEKLEASLRGEMRRLEQRMTIRIGGMMVVAVGLAAAAGRFL